MVMVLPVGKWQPDIYNLNSGFALDVLNVLPGVGTKKPWPSLEAYSGALGAVCRGAVLVRDAAGSNQIFAGKAGSLHKLDSSDLTWTDVTRSAGGAYNLPAGDRWSFDMFGANLYAAQIGDAMQVIDAASGTNFAAVGGSPPQVRYIKTIGDQLFAMSDSTKGNRISWSGRNNPAFWTFGGGQDCDQQEFPDGGFVRGMSGVFGGFVFQDDAVRSFRPSAGREIYSFAKVDNASGLTAPDSLVSHLDVTYYLGGDGFCSIGSNGINQIGYGHVDEWFLRTASSDGQQLALTIGCMDPNRPRIFWAFTTLSSGYTLDQILCYDILLKEWTHAEVEVEVLLRGATAGYTMEGLADLFSNLDTLGISLDSSLWSGGSPVLGAVAVDQMLSFFSGAALAAVVDMSEMQLVPGRRAYVRGCRPYTDAPNVTLAVGTRNTQAKTEAVSYRMAMSRNSSGWCPARASGRYHTVRASIPAGEDWTHFQGVEPDFSPEGER
jgi:hypothetical protein